jgi:hypothetical protein
MNALEIRNQKMFELFLQNMECCEPYQYVKRLATMFRISFDEAFEILETKTNYFSRLVREQAKSL